MGKPEKKIGSRNIITSLLECALSPKSTVYSTRGFSPLAPGLKASPGSTERGAGVVYLEVPPKSPVVVFDGYDTGPTTKDIAHLRRAAGAFGPVVKFTEDMVLSSRKDHFLSSPQNKQAFIKMIGTVLELNKFTVLHAIGDADTLIASTALQCSGKCNTTVIGEDADLLVLLCFHTGLGDQPVILHSDRHTGSKHRIWHIQSLKQNLGPEICQLLPFIHAVNGCDTTYRFYGIGKGVLLKKMKSDSTFKQQGHIFCSRHQNQETIIAAGEKALVCLYNGRTGESMDTLRYNRFCEKVATCATSVDVQSLPPTSPAAKYHSLRVYLQVQEWITLKSDLKPEERGWQHSSSNRLEPQITDLPPAPEALLRVIRSNCSRDCQSRRCTCRKFGLECSVACGGYRGLICSNSPVFKELDCDLPDISDTVSHTEMPRVDEDW